MINENRKFIFIHIPKCGGSSIQKILQDEDCTMNSGWDSRKKKFKQHCTISQLRNVYNIKIAEYFSFTFVRNPWDKVVSDHFYWQRKESPFKKILKGTTIKDYLLCRNGYEFMNHLDNNLGRADHFCCQHKYIIDQNKKNIVNFIGRFENLQQDFNIICDKINMPRVKLPHLNKSKHEHYSQYYDAETREIANKKYAKDIEYFGYKFGIEDRY